jgi:hypothetical protein
LEGSAVAKHVTTDDPLNISSADPAWRAFEKDIANLTARVGAAPSSVIYDQKLLGVNSKIPRQIDVYVEGEVSGIPIAIAIECKRYGRKIDVGDMDAFVGKLRDLAVDKGVFYVHDGVTAGARNSASAALHPKIVLREFAGAMLPPEPWDDLIGWDCPNENCLTGAIGWTDYPQPAGGADVQAGYCDSCGTFVFRCRDCEAIDSADYGETQCYNCGATYDIVPERKGAEVDDVVQLTRGED